MSLLVDALGIAVALALSSGLLEGARRAIVGRRMAHVLAEAAPRPGLPARPRSSAGCSTWRAW